MRCRDCFDLAEAAAAFAAAGRGGGRGQEVESAALWRLLRPQLDHRVLGTSARSPPARGGGRPGVSPALGLAALFFVALVGLSAWNLHQRSALKRCGRRRPTRPSSISPPASAPPPGRELTFRPDPGCSCSIPPRSSRSTGWRSATPRAAREVASDELRPNGTSPDPLPPGGLRPGRYRLELSDGRRGSGEGPRDALLRVTEPRPGRLKRPGR